jgi:hypothetical protein
MLCKKVTWEISSCKREADSEHTKLNDVIEVCFIV